MFLERARPGGGYFDRGRDTGRLSRTVRRVTYFPLICTKINTLRSKLVEK